MEPGERRRLLLQPLGWLEGRRYLSVTGHTEVPCDCKETRLQESDQGKCALFRSRYSPTHWSRHPIRSDYLRRSQKILTGVDGGLVPSRGVLDQSARRKISRTAENTVTSPPTHVRVELAPIVAPYTARPTIGWNEHVVFREAEKVYSTETSRRATVFAQFEVLSNLVLNESGDHGDHSDIICLG